MQALPPDPPADGQESLAGLVCPDCGGSMAVRRDQELWTFACRVGHEYSATEFLAAKEEQIERALWGAVYAFEEMAQLLTDVARHPHLAASLDALAREARRAAAEAQAARLRSLVQADRPLTLGRPDAVEADEQRSAS